VDAFMLTSTPTTGKVAAIINGTGNGAIPPTDYYVSVGVAVADGTYGKIIGNAVPFHINSLFTGSSTIDGASVPTVGFIDTHRIMVINHRRAVLFDIAPVTNILTVVQNFAYNTLLQDGNCQSRLYNHILDVADGEYNVEFIASAPSQFMLHTAYTNYISTVEIDQATKLITRIHDPVWSNKNDPNSTIQKKIASDAQIADPLTLKDKKYLVRSEVSGSDYVMQGRIVNRV